MAFNTSAQDPRLLKVAGETTEMACGISTASGSALTITVPQLSYVYGAVAMTFTNAAANVAVTATSGNTFTVATTNAADVFAWIAWGKAKM